MILNFASIFTDPLQLLVKKSNLNFAFVVPTLNIYQYIPMHCLCMFHAINHYACPERWLTQTHLLLQKWRETTHQALTPNHATIPKQATNPIVPMLITPLSHVCTSFILNSYLNCFILLSYKIYTISFPGHGDISMDLVEISPNRLRFGFSNAFPDGGHPVFLSVGR